jgi:DUF1009 family protein
MIGVEAHGAMILERPVTLERAQALGITLYGHE